MDLFTLSAKLQLDKSEYDKGLDDSESKAYQTGQKIGTALNAIGKFTMAGITVAAAGLAALTKDATQEYAAYQQLMGGVQKLYGAAGMSIEQYAESVGKSVDEVQDKYAELTEAQELVVANAEQAFQTAGMSSMQYMETATSFSAALVNSLGGDTLEAAKQTDIAMRAISDNYNTFGGDMQLIQNAYMGFAKANYTMLDNLKLGYGGTKTEMERLIADANQYAASIGMAADLSIDSFSDIVTAIELVQEKQGIAGTTAREAATTVEGSINQLKGAWQNLVAGMANDEADLGKLIDDVIESAKTAAGNLMPVIEQAIHGALQLVTEVVPIITEELPKIIDDLLPPLLDAASQLFLGVVNALPRLIEVFVDAIPRIMATILPPLIKGVSQLITAIAKQLPKMIKEIIKIIPTLVKSITDALMEEFPQFEAVFRGISDVVGGLFSFIENNSGFILSALKSILGGFIAFEAIMGVFNLVTTAITGVTTAITVLQTAMTVLAANPVVLLAAGVAGLTALFIAGSEAAKKHAEELGGLSEVQLQAYEAAKQYNDEMQRLSDSNNDIVTAIDLQYQSEKTLLEELQSIVDENGRVKDGYEDRARVITEQLSSAYGIEIEMQGNVITNYDEIVSKIDEVIEHKKAEALLSANQQEYIDALDAQQGLYDNLVSAQEAVNNAQQAYNDNLEYTQELEQQILDYNAQGLYDAAGTAAQNLEQANAQFEDLQANIDAATEAYNEQAAALAANQSYIENYDNLMAVATTGVGDLSQAINDFSNNLITNAPYETMYEQYEQAWDAYNSAMEMAQSESIHISEEMINQLHDHAIAASNALASAYPDMVNAGELLGQGVVTGVDNSYPAVNEAGHGMATGMTRSIETVQPEMERIGAKFGDVFLNNFKDRTPTEEFRNRAVESVNSYNEGFTSELPRVDEKLSSFMTNMNLNLRKMTEESNTTVKDSMFKHNDDIVAAVSKIDDHLGISLRKIQNTFEQTYKAIVKDTQESFNKMLSTIKEKMETIKTFLEESIQKISDMFTSLVGSSYQWGSDFVQNFEDGILSRMHSLLETVRAMAAEIRSYLHFSVPDKGPLSDADEWMPDMIDLFIGGLEKNKGRLMNTVEDTFDFEDAIVRPYELETGASGRQSINSRGDMIFNINIYQPMDDAADVARKIREEMQYGLLGGEGFAY